MRRTLKLENEIKDFYLENSTLDPNKKLWVKIAGEKIQKQYLNQNIKNLCDQFNHQNGKNISYSTFARHRPRQCVFRNIEARDTCACITHENMKMLIKYLYSKKIIVMSTDYQAVKSITCPKSSLNCFNRQCLRCRGKTLPLKFEASDENLHTFKKWITTKEHRVSEKTRRPIVVTIAKKQELIMTKEELEIYFEKEFSDFLQHIHRFLFQHREIQNLTSSLLENEIAIDIDWSENYNCKYAVEIQGVHFGASRQQITIHTGMLYTKTTKKGFASFSECLRHDSCAVIAHVIKILSEMKKSGLISDKVDTLHIVSDGLTAQYKNKNMFRLLTQYLPKFFLEIVTITHSYSEKGHGKGGKDGIGATLKRTGDDVVEYGADVNDYSALLKTIEKNAQIFLLLTLLEKKLTWSIQIFLQNLKLLLVLGYFTN